MADYALIESAVNNKISDLIKKYPGASVVTTGHSLGGALAMISALELRRTFANLKVEVHSYGAPRIGNVHLARHVNNKI
jgi:predicted lipase